MRNANRVRNASGVITLIHCLSTTNHDYDMDLLPLSYMKQIVDEYYAYTNHLSKYRDYMPLELTSKGEALEKIRRQLLKLNLISENQETNEHA